MTAAGQRFLKVALVVAPLLLGAATLLLALQAASPPLPLQSQLSSGEMIVPLITVAPLADGWRLSVDRIANDMVFRSGRAAESAARRLALRLSRAGVPTEVRIHLRDNSTAARFVCPAIGSDAPTPGVGAATRPAGRVLEAA